MDSRTLLQIIQYTAPSDVFKEVESISKGEDSARQQLRACKDATIFLLNKLRPEFELRSQHHETQTTFNRL